MVHQVSNSKTILTLMVLFFLCQFLQSCSSEVNYTPPEDSKDIAITHYSFGKIIVDGKIYEDDILVYPDKTVKRWQAKINHLIQLTDIELILDTSTTTLIIGIGATKMCEVEQNLIDYIVSKGIRLYLLNTYEAVELFNSTPKEGLSACFHVNC